MVKENLFSQLKTKLKDKDLSDGSINLYLRNLKKLNNNEEFNNLKFLSKPDEVVEKIKDLKDNTKRQYLISIVSCLKAMGNKPALYKKYYKLMISINDKIKEKPTEEKTETQNKNWLSWDEVMKIYNDMKDNLKLNKTKITEKQYDDLFNYVLLSLYVLIPPRRNLDWQKMAITFNGNIEDNKYNYLDYNKKQFVFNVFKTAKKDGKLTLDIPDNLMEVINLYLKYHPLNKNMKKEPKLIPFLVDYKGNPFSKVNDITRMLNKIFHKKVGASMLRHIYLSGKYGDVLKQQEQDAKAMSHNLSTQKDYIKL
jgi:hypothetical protein